MTTIRIEDYMARSYLDDLKEKYEPKPKEKKPVTTKLAALASIPIVGNLITETAVASGYSSSTYFSSPSYASTTQVMPGGFYEEQMIAVSGPISDAVKQKIISAFDPLVDLIIALSLPVAGVMLAGGALMIMVGLKDNGFKLIMNAGLGYVLVQMSPLFIDLLAGVGAAI
ncbi:hypothetical protein ACFOZY_03120 [Chungangia koreensis]|uniref:Uncharacterized protein n=1 Tax=Chungangia koreensis TaxID=752657 RepID=A0ABV8X2S5_9LACT